MVDYPNFQNVAGSNFAEWNNVLTSGNPEAMADLYAPGAVFLPTLSPQLVTGREGVVGYFEHFMAKNPDGTIIEDAVVSLSDIQFLHAGLYDFEIDDPATGGRAVVHARFTYIWELFQDRWFIVHHHSSLLPEGH